MNPFKKDVKFVDGPVPPLEEKEVKTEVEPVENCFHTPEVYTGPGKPIPGAKPVYTDTTCLEQDWWSYHTKE